MEKLDINEFLKKKEEISNLIENAEENINQNNLIEEEVVNIYLKMINEITEYDLSEIPFEAWENFNLYVSKNHSLDFSKTRANIDFNLIEYEIEDNKNINFRNCNLKNYDFYYKAYSPNMFDEKFIKEHQDKFLDDSAPENIKNIVYNRKFITIKEIKDNIELIKYIDYLYLENKKIYKEIYNKIGENEFLKLDENIFKYSEELKQKEIKTILSSDFSTAKEIEDKLYDFISLEIRPNQYNEEMKKRYPDYFFDIKEDDENKYVKEQFNNGRLSIEEIIGNWDILKGKNLDYILIKSNYNMYINKHKLDTKALNKIMNTELIKMFIKNNIEFDINKIINDDHKFNNNINSYINQLIKKDDIDSLNEEIFTIPEFINNLYMSETTKKESLKEFIKNILYIHQNNEEIEKNIIERLKSSIDEEFLISDEAPYYLKEKFYKREISVEYIKSNLAEYNQYLKNKDLGYFTNCPIIYNIQDKLGKENGFAYWIENGTYIDRAYKQNVKGLKYSDDITKEDFMKEIDEYIINGIKNGAKYDDKMSEQFKEKYRELFLVENAPEELKKVFYNREIDFEYISLHPEYNEYLKNKDLENLLKYMPIQIENEEISLAQIIKEKIGNEEGFEFLLKNGKYIERAFKNNADTNNLTNYKNMTKEDFLKEIEEYIMDGIKKGAKYDDKMTDTFKEKHKEMFLESSISKEIQEKFYNKKLTLEDIENNKEIQDALNNKKIFFGFPKEVVWVNELFRSNDSLQQTNLQRLKIIKEFEKIEDIELRNVFGEFCKTSMETEINESILENIESVSEVLKRLSLTNSTEMFKFRAELANQILKTNNPIKNFEKMENIFIGNETPTFVKLYQCNDIVNHNLSERFSFDRKGIMSPVLIRSNDIFKRLIIFSDLAKLELYSNNKSVKEFLNKVEIENKLYTDIKNGNIKYDDLDEENKKLLKSFSKILCVTYNNSISIKDANSEEYHLTENTLKDIEELSTLVCGNNKNLNLGDEIIRKTFALNNINTIDEARRAMTERISKIDQRNRKVGNENTNITLNKGDYVKGIGSIEFLGKILQGGSVSREFLGENSGSDATPLDTDLSKITIEIGTNLDKINKTVSKGYGPIYFILKDDDKFVTTIEDKDDLLKRQYSSNEEYYKEYLSKMTRDMTKNEIFCTGAIRK